MKKSCIFFEKKDALRQTKKKEMFTGRVCFCTFALVIGQGRTVVPGGSMSYRLNHYQSLLIPFEMHIFYLFFHVTITFSAFIISQKISFVNIRVETDISKRK